MATNYRKTGAVLALLHALPAGEFLSVQEISLHSTVMIDATRVNAMLCDVPELHVLARTGKISVTKKTGKMANWYLYLTDAERDLVPIAPAVRLTTATALVKTGDSQSDAVLHDHNAALHVLRSRMKGSPKKAAAALLEVFAVRNDTQIERRILSETGKKRRGVDIEIQRELGGVD